MYEGIWPDPVPPSTHQYCLFSCNLTFSPSQICACMHNAHTSSLFRHSTAFLLRAPALAGGSCQYPSFPLLAFSNFVFDLRKRLSADNTLGTSGKAQKHVFRPRGDQFVETNYVTPNEQASLILSLAMLCVTALEDIKTV